MLLPNTIRGIGNLIIPALLTLVFTAGFAVADSPVKNHGADIDFEKQIKPIFEKHCLSCHGPELEEGFRIDIKDDALAYVEEESAEDSDLYLVLVSEDEDEIMPPPDDENPLTKEQIALVEQWINEGAEWPEGLKFVDTKNAQATESAPKESDTSEEPAKEAENGAADSTEEEGSDPPKKKKKPVDKETQQVYNAIGSLHPAAIHLPLGLLLAAGFFALLSLRGNFVMSDCAYYCLWLGAITAVAGCVTGWYFSPMEHRGTVETWSDLFDDKHKVFWHRTGALVVTIASLLLAMFAASARSRDPDEGVSWKLGLIVIAAAIGWVGHTGGELHYPSNHYEDLNAVYNRMIGGGEKKAEEKPAAVDETSTDAERAEADKEKQQLSADEDDAPIGEDL